MKYGVLLWFAASVAAALHGKEAQAHARWKAGSTVSPPRDLASGLKTPPCGGAVRTNTPKSYKPGQTINVEFEETINHPGYYEIYILGENEVPLSGFGQPLVTVMDTQNTPISNGQNHQYTAPITLPNITCENCSLQLIQVMTENPIPSRYYSCSDIRISNAASPLDQKGGAKPPKPTNIQIQVSP